MVVDDHPLLREGIIAVLSRDSRFAVVAQAGDGLEAIRQFMRHRPDITLMDLHMPVMGGLDSMVEIRKSSPHARIIVMAAHQGDEQALRSLEAGAEGCLPKTMLRTELATAIMNVHGGATHIPPGVDSELAAYIVADGLTRREIEVLRTVAAGNTNRRAGQLLGIGDEAMRAHMNSILAKLKAADRTHAVTIAIRRGIIEP